MPRRVSFERLELIRRRYHEIAQIHRTIQIFQLFAGALLNLPVESLHELACEYRPTVFILESPDHGEEY
jgi:hypothetical protein